MTTNVEKEGKALSFFCSDFSGSSESRSDPSRSLLAAIFCFFFSPNFFGGEEEEEEQNQKVPGDWAMSMVLYIYKDSRKWGEFIYYYSNHEKDQRNIEEGERKARAPDFTF